MQTKGLIYYLKILALQRNKINYKFKLNNYKPNKIPMNKPDNLA